MRILISGLCGFVGSNIAMSLAAHSQYEIVGIDNLSRRGSPGNIARLEQAGVRFVHGDVRLSSDIAACGQADTIIDAAAIPSVLAGVNQTTSSRQVVEANLIGTVNLLEHAKTHSATFVLLSSSRVYSISTLSKLPLETSGEQFELRTDAALPTGVGEAGISEDCPTTAPVSLYGASKLASEALAMEYHYAFQIPVWINRCGVMAGAGQFGKSDQGIFAYWLHAWRARQQLTYLGFEGTGKQTRDCLHPADLAELLLAQIQEPTLSQKPRVANVSGGLASAISLRQLSQWCEQRWGPLPVSASNSQRPYDLPWIVLDSSLARKSWNWQPKISTQAILKEIADFADANPGFCS